ncbi:channel voltage activated chloride channel [Achlya hypogyna]|uniref:Chloride channel protein n=1 Tax=Achlya hypogyna TaxID=1202772 RepID=A0A1V9YYM1_ACHHY|nr:channel voltage activated chloride channel [Achlya hypogyna]
MTPMYAPLGQREPARPLYESVDFVPYDSPGHLHSPACYSESNCPDLQKYPPPRPGLLRSFLGHETTSAFLKWCLSFVIGVITAYISIVISTATISIISWKFAQLKSLIEKEKTGDVEGGVGILFLVAVNAALVGVASTIIVHVAPSAAGSGIPETKSTLNGVLVKAWMSPATLLCKTMGITMSVAGGLPVGREGPLIHIGATVATILTSKRSYQCGQGARITLLREKDVRDLVTCGAAAGVAAAFGAPIGGVLFALEEGASFLSPKLIWRAFFCAMTAAFVGFGTTVFLGGSFTEETKKSVLFSFGKMSDPSVDRAAYVPYELLVFVGMGIAGGILGALYIRLNHLIVFTWNAKGLKASLKVLYVVVLGAGVSLAWFGLAYVVGTCKPVPTPMATVPEKLELRSELVRFYCGANQYNDLASLFLTSPDIALKQLLHFGEVATAPSDFTASSLLAYGFCIFLGSALAFGSSISGGVFIPCILSGAALGRLFGGLMQSDSINYMHLSTYSLVGAAAMLGGVTRMTISLTIILLEATGDLQYALPLMMTLMSARWVGNWLSDGLYDVHIHGRGIPFLDWSPPAAFETFTVAHVMKEEPLYLCKRESVGHLLSTVLERPHDHAWAVVDADGSHVLTGTLQRSTLCALLLDKTTWRDEFLRGSFEADERENSIEAVDFSKSDRDTIINLERYINPSPFLIPVEASAAQAYRLFRSLGLSSLCVVTKTGELAGIITRDELYHFSRQSYS